MRFRGEYNNSTNYYYSDAVIAEELLNDLTFSLNLSNNEKYITQKTFTAGETINVNVSDLTTSGSGTKAYVRVQGWHSSIESETNYELIGEISSKGENQYILQRSYEYILVDIINVGYSSVSADIVVSQPTMYENNCIIRDYVSYQGSTYFVRNYSTKSIKRIEPTDIDYWQMSTHIPVLTVNNLLAQNAMLGQFSVSNHIFTANNGTLVLNSVDGSITAKAGYIGGFTIEEN